MTAKCSEYQNEWPQNIPSHRLGCRAFPTQLALPKMNAETDLDYVMNAVSTIRRELNGRVPLIGFSGSPWTLATYMIEGGSSKTFSEAKKLMYGQPEVMHRLLDHLADSVIDYLNGQIKACLLYTSPSPRD